MKKRILSILLAVVMVITCSSVLGASAEDAIDGGTLTLNTPAGCTVSAEYLKVSYTFTAPEDGIYYFYSETAELDPFAELYQGDVLLSGNDDIGYGNLNFGIEQTLTKDTVYTLVCWSIDRVGSFKVHVTKLAPPTGVEITADASLKMYAGKTQQLYAELVPELCIEEPITSWTSSDPTVVTVDSEGWVEALKVGTATITAETESGAKGTAVITVAAPEALALGQPVLVEEYTCYTFTPAETGYYRIYSTNCGPTDPVVDIYEGD